MRLTILLGVTFLMIVIGCKKDKPAPPLPSTPVITAFAFNTTNNSTAKLPFNESGIIKNDSIIVTIPDSIVVTSLIPDIQFTGSSISPSADVAQDFSKPVTYTVTGEGGAKIIYTVKLIKVSDNKSITAFSFLSSLNTNLGTDVQGIIRNDSIFIEIPAGVPLNGLIPSVKYTGVSINPGNNVITDFSAPVTYTVTAQDGSTTSYTVLADVMQDVYFGSADGYIYRLDGQTGILKWKLKVGAIVTSAPTIDNGIVITSANDNYVYAIDAASGKIKWKQYAFGPVCAYPTVHNGKIYVASYIVGDGNMMALDETTGNVIWVDYDYSVYGSPTVNGNLVYEGDLGTALLTFDASNGSTPWYVDNGITVENTAVADGLIFNGGESSKLFAADALTGALKWRILQGSSPSKPVGSPTVADSTVYVGESDNNLYAFDEFTGTIKWTLVEPGYFSSPIVENRILYAQSNNGHFYALDASTGTTIWTYDLPGTNDCTLANGTIYEGGNDGNMYALNAGTGTLKWIFNTGSSGINGGACVQDSKGTVYHCGGSGDHN